MYALLALMATVLTSFLPVLNKRLRRDARPAFVAWAINAFQFPSYFSSPFHQNLSLGQVLT
jgi:hypothetical protein